jgi:putrescine transport system permease protein
MKMKPEHRWRWWLIAVPYVWLLVFFLVPFLIIFKISFADPVLAVPPYTPLIGTADDGSGVWQGTLDNYRFLFGDDLYLLSYLNSIRIAFFSTLLCLLIGYPMALAIARTPQPWRNLLLVLVILPFWTSFLLRVYAWMGLLSQTGLVNKALLALGLIERPLTLLYTDFAIYLGIVYTYLPFMILPLYASLEKLDRDVHEAAADLGAPPWRVFLDVTLPLSIPGIIAGALLVFIPATGEFVIPALLGGSDALMIGRTMFDEFFFNRDWPVSAALATVLLLLLVVPIMLFQHFTMREGRAAS